MSAQVSHIYDVDAIIVAHDSGATLEAAVASVEGQVAPGRVVIVDAGSTDGSVDQVAATHPGVRVIRTANLGFAAANNVGIAATNGEFVLLLNPDAVLEDLSVEPLAARARSNRSAGVVAPRVTDPDGRTQVGSFGRFPSLRRALEGRANRLVYRMSGGRTSGGRVDVHGTTTVDWVTGACMLVRRKAIDAVGPMDEGFFLYYEDVDWCHRMHDAGWSVLIEPDAVCVHLRGGSGGGDTPVGAKAYRASFFRYCKKYDLRAYALAERLELWARRTANWRK